jgi:hypothetical protein
MAKRGNAGCGAPIHVMRSQAFNRQNTRALGFILTPTRLSTREESWTSSHCVALGRTVAVDSPRPSIPSVLPSLSLGRPTCRIRLKIRRRCLRNLGFKRYAALNSCDSSGCLMMSFSRHTTPPGGANLPCSQSRSVATGVAMRSAKAA